MKNELIKSRHAVGESNFHLQLTPAYRRDIFWDEQVAELFVSNVRFVSEVELVRQVKGYSSRMMRKNFWHLFKAKLLGKKFWTEGHFYRSVGAVNSETMKHYIEESQEKHWKKVSIIKIEIVSQKRISDY